MSYGIQIDDLDSGRGSVTAARGLRPTVKFAMLPVNVENAAIGATDREGKPIVNGVQPRPYLLFSSPYDTFSKPAVAKLDRHEREYPREWAAFIEGEQERVAINGTLLAEVPRFSRREVEIMALYNITLVEEAAQMPATVKLKGGAVADAVEAKAKAYLAATSDVGEPLELAEQNADLKRRLGEIEEANRLTLQELQAKEQQLGALQTALAGRGSQNDAPMMQQGMPMDAGSVEDLPYDGLIPEDVVDDIVGEPPK